MQSAASVKKQSVATSGYIDYKSTIIFGNLDKTGDEFM